MKKIVSLVMDVCILVSVWLLFVLLLVYISVVDLYFPQFEISGSVALVSGLLLAIAYTIFWIKRFRKSRVR